MIDLFEKMDLNMNDIKKIMIVGDTSPNSADPGHLQQDVKKRERAELVEAKSKEPGMWKGNARSVLKKTHGKNPQGETGEVPM